VSEHRVSSWGFSENIRVAPPEPSPDAVLPEYLTMVQEPLSEMATDKAATVLKKQSELVSKAIDRLNGPPPDAVERARIDQLLAEHGITDTDSLKHRLEDWDRWSLDVAKYSSENAALRKEVERLKTCSTIEVMCENQNVDYHVTEWEKRAETAEARVAELESENAAMADSLHYEECDDYDCPRCNAILHGAALKAKEQRA
jgi:hypothetical protein